MIYFCCLNVLLKGYIFLQTKYYCKLFNVSQDVCQKDGYSRVVWCINNQTSVLNQESPWENQTIRAPGILPVLDIGEERELDFSIEESHCTEIEKLFLPVAKTWLGSAHFDWPCPQNFYASKSHLTQDYTTSTFVFPGSKLGYYHCFWRNQRSIVELRFQM